MSDPQVVNERPTRLTHKLDES